MDDPENPLETPPQEPQQPYEPTGAELLAAIRDFARTIPTLEQIERAAESAAARRVNALVAEVEATKLKEVQDFQAKAAEFEKLAQANGTKPPAATSNGQQPAIQGAGGVAKYADIANLVLAVLKGVSEAAAPLMNQAYQFQVQRQNLKLMQTSPIAIAQHLMAVNPTEAQYVAALLYPDPMRQQIPGMIANAVDVANRAQAMGFLRSGVLGMPSGVGGAWVILPNGRRLWDPNAPAGPSTPPPGTGNGVAPTNPLGSPLLLDPNQIPGQTPGSANPTSPGTPGQNPAINAPPSSFAPNPSKSPGLPGSSNATPSNPLSSPNGTPVTPSSASPGINGAGSSNPSQPSPAIRMASLLRLKW